MTIKEAALWLTASNSISSTTMCEAQRVLFENRLMLTGEACPVCGGTGVLDRCITGNINTVCSYCFGSGRELARVWPPEMAERWFGRPVRSAPVEHRVWFTAEGFANAVDRVLDWANHRRRFARERKRREVERDPFVNAQR